MTIKTVMKYQLTPGRPTHMKKRQKPSIWADIWEKITYIQC